MTVFLGGDASVRLGLYPDKERELEFQEIVKGRYATKLFDGRPVPEETIEKLLELVRLAPSGLNLQPWRIRVITSAKQKEAIQPLCFNQAQISSCSHLLVFCACVDADVLVSRLDALMRSGEIPDALRGVLVGMSKSMFEAMSAGQKAEWTKCQVYLALGNAVNGAKSLGLDSCPMTGFDEAALTRLLELPADHVLTALCPVGYAADTPMATKLRFPMRDLLF